MNFPELPDEEASILENIDHFVERGIPREVVERCTKEAFEVLTKILELIPNPAQGDYGNKLWEISLTKALIVGGLSNWTDSKKSSVTLALFVLENVYRLDADNKPKGGI